MRLISRFLSSAKSGYRMTEQLFGRSETRRFGRQGKKGTTTQALRMESLEERQLLSVTTGNEEELAVAAGPPVTTVIPAPATITTTSSVSVTTINATNETPTGPVEASDGHYYLYQADAAHLDTGQTVFEQSGSGIKRYGVTDQSSYWAQTAADLLWSAGWAQNAGFTSSNDVQLHILENFPAAQDGYVNDVVEWFITGDYRNVNDRYYNHSETATTKSNANGGGFFQEVNYDAVSSYVTAGIDDGKIPNYNAKYATGVCDQDAMNQVFLALDANTAVSVDLAWYMTTSGTGKGSQSWTSYLTSGGNSLWIGKANAPTMNSLLINGLYFNPRNESESSTEHVLAISFANGDPAIGIEADVYYLIEWDASIAAYRFAIEPMWSKAYNDLSYDAKAISDRCNADAIFNAWWNDGHDNTSGNIRYLTGYTGTAGKYHVNYTTPAGVQYINDGQNDNRGFQTMAFTGLNYLLNYYEKLPEASLNDCTKLQSNPGATNVIYLDSSNFDVEFVKDRLCFQEKVWLQEIYQRVAEDYAPFDVNVTTDPTVTGSGTTYTIDIWSGFSGSYRDQHRNGSAGGYNPIFSSDAATGPSLFYMTMFGIEVSYSCTLQKMVAEYVSYNVARRAGLSDSLWIHSESGGATETSKYPGRGDWGPIMGFQASVSQQLTQWSMGEYAGAINAQNQVALLAARLGIRQDDYANTYTEAITDERGQLKATPYTNSYGSTQMICQATGVIGVLDAQHESRDKDFFSFESYGGEYVINLAGIGNDTRWLDVENCDYDWWMTNLNLQLDVYDSMGNLMRTVSSTTTSFAHLRIDLPSKRDENGDLVYDEEGKLVPETYYFCVSGVGEGNSPQDGYSSYGSLGQYTISVTEDYSDLIHLDPVTGKSYIVVTTLDDTIVVDNQISLREALYLIGRRMEDGTYIENEIRFDYSLIYNEELDREYTREELENGAATFRLNQEYGSLILNYQLKSAYAESDRAGQSSLSTIINGQSFWNSDTNTYETRYGSNITIDARDENGDSNFRALYVDNIDATVYGLIFTGGNAKAELSSDSNAASQDNNNQYGGGVFNHYGWLSINDSIIAGNSALKAGGGIYNMGGWGPMHYPVASGNEQDFNDYFGGLWVSNSAITGNITTFDKSANTGSVGGGIYNDFVAKAEFYNCTIAGNASAWSGGGIDNNGQVILYNSIVAKNYSSHGSDVFTHKDGYYSEGFGKNDAYTRGSYSFIGDITYRNDSDNGVEPNKPAFKNGETYGSSINLDSNSIYGSSGINVDGSRNFNLVKDPNFVIFSDGWIVWSEKYNISGYQKFNVVDLEGTYDNWYYDLWKSWNLSPTSISEVVDSGNNDLYINSYYAAHYGDMASQWGRNTPASWIQDVRDMTADTTTDSYSSLQEYWTARLGVRYDEYLAYITAGYYDQAVESLTEAFFDSVSGKILAGSISTHWNWDGFTSELFSLFNVETPVDAKINTLINDECAGNPSYLLDNKVSTATDAKTYRVTLTELAKTFRDNIGGDATKINTAVAALQSFMSTITSLYSNSYVNLPERQAAVRAEAKERAEAAADDVMEVLAQAEIRSDIDTAAANSDPYLTDPIELRVSILGAKILAGDTSSNWNWVTFSNYLFTYFNSPFLSRNAINDYINRNCHNDYTTGENASTILDQPSASDPTKTNAVVLQELANLSGTEEAHEQFDKLLEQLFGQLYLDQNQRANAILSKAQNTLPTSYTNWYHSANNDAKYWNIRDRIFGTNFTAKWYSELNAKLQSSYWLPKWSTYDAAAEDWYKTVTGKTSWIAGDSLEDYWKNYYENNWDYTNFAEELWNISKAAKDENNPNGDACTQCKLYLSSMFGLSSSSTDNVYDALMTALDTATSQLLFNAALRTIEIPQLNNMTVSAYYAANETDMIANRINYQRDLDIAAQMVEIPYVLNDTPTNLKDLAAFDRIVDGNGDGDAVIDMGAYEYQLGDPDFTGFTPETINTTGVDSDWDNPIIIGKSTGDRIGIGYEVDENTYVNIESEDITQNTIIYDEDVYLSMAYMNRGSFADTTVTGDVVVNVDLAISNDAANFSAAYAGSFSESYNPADYDTTKVTYKTLFSITISAGDYPDYATPRETTITVTNNAWEGGIQLQNPLTFPDATQDYVEEKLVDDAGVELGTLRVYRNGLITVTDLFFDVNKQTETQAANQRGMFQFTMAIDKDVNGDYSTLEQRRDNNFYSTIVRVIETPSLIVTTTADNMDMYDGEITLREAISYASYAKRQEVVLDEGTRISFVTDQGSNVTYEVRSGKFYEVLSGDFWFVDSVSSPATYPLHDGTAFNPGDTITIKEDCVANYRIYNGNELANTTEVQLATGTVLTYVNDDKGEYFQDAAGRTYNLFYNTAFTINGTSARYNTTNLVSVALTTGTIIDIVFDETNVQWDATESIFNKVENGCYYETADPVTGKKTQTALVTNDTVTVDVSNPDSTGVYKVLLGTMKEEVCGEATPLDLIYDNGSFYQIDPLTNVKTFYVLDKGTALTFTTGGVSIDATYQIQKLTEYANPADWTQQEDANPFTLIATDADGTLIEYDYIVDEADPTQSGWKDAEGNAFTPVANTDYVLRNTQYDTTGDLSEYEVAFKGGATINVTEVWGDVIHFEKEGVFDNGAVITIDSTLYDTFEINKDLTIDATTMWNETDQQWEDASSKITISGNNAVEVIHIAADKNVRMTNLVITEGLSDTTGGGIGIEAEANVALDRVDITNNTAATFGGGIYNLGTLSFTNGTVSNNTIINTVKGFNANETFAGAGIYSGPGATLSFTHTDENANTITGKVKIDANTIIINADKNALNSSIYAYGAGVYTEEDIDLVDMPITNNKIVFALKSTSASAHAYGGGVYTKGNITATTSVDVKGTEYETIFTGNQSGMTDTVNSASTYIKPFGYGGAVYADGNITLTDIVTIGGFDDSATTIDDMIAKSNMAGHSGGAIYAKGDVTLAMSEEDTRTIPLSGNMALEGSGGVIYAKGAIKLTDISGIAYNIAGLSGGALYSESSINVTGTEGLSSVMYNATRDGSGGVFAANGNIQVSGFEVFGNNFAGIPAATTDPVLALLASKFGTSADYSLCNGGIAWSEADVTIEDISLIDNTVAGGCGGVIWANGKVTLIGNDQISTTIINSTAGVNGGVIYGGGEILLVGIESIETSTAGQNGGVIYGLADVEIIDEDGILSITDSKAITGDGGIIYAGGKVSLEGINNISDSNAGQDGGAIYTSGEVYLSDITISDSHAGRDGGVVYAGGNINLENGSKLTESTAGQSGGALYAKGNIMAIAGAEFTNNTAAALMSNDPVPVKLAQENGFGGVIYADGTVYLANAILTGNNTMATGDDQGHGGAIYAGADVTLDGNVVITGNTATGSGGAIYTATSLDVLLPNAKVFVKGLGVQIIGNVAGVNGGGIYSSGDLTAANAFALTGNTALANGGALFACGNIDIKDSQIYGNSATGTDATSGIGGAIYHQGTDKTVRLTNTALYGNLATNNGGGIYSDGTIVLVNATVAANNALNGLGGGLYSEGSLLFNNSVIASNRAGNQGGVQYPGTDVFYNNVNQDVQVNYSLIGRGIGNGTGGITPNVQNVAFIGTEAEEFAPEFEIAPTWNATSGILENLDELVAENGLALRGYSVGVDGGSNALAIYSDESAIVNDVAAQQRIFNGTVDLGAWELQKTVQCDLAFDDSKIDDPTAFTYTKSVVFLDSENNVVASVENGSSISLALTFFNVSNDAKWKGPFEISVKGYLLENGVKPADPFQTVTTTYGLNGESLNPNEWAYCIVPWGEIEVGQYVFVVELNSTRTISEIEYENNLYGNDEELKQTFLQVKAPSKLVVTTEQDEFDLTNNETSLREALYWITDPSFADLANREITFSDDMVGKTITLDSTHGQLTVERSVTIDATSIGGITIDAGGNSRAFKVSEYESYTDAENNIKLEAKFVNMTITNGNAITDNLDVNYSAGGAIDNAALGMLTLENCTITNNTAAYGGAIRNVGNMTITNSTITSNTTTNHGGAIYNGGNLTMNLVNISGNTAAKYGGGIAQFGTSLKITNSIISGNRGSNGGGILIQGTRTNTTLVNCTVAGNTATKQGGGLWIDSPNAEIVNSIVAKNSATEGVNVYTLSGTIPTYENSMYVSDADPAFVDFSTATSWETWNLRVQSGSTVIDKGNSARVEGDYDFAGNRRINNIVDMGAYEYYETQIIPATTTLELTGNAIPVGTTITTMDVAAVDKTGIVYEVTGDNAANFTMDGNSLKTLQRYTVVDNKFDVTIKATRADGTIYAEETLTFTVQRPAVPTPSLLASSQMSSTEIFLQWEKNSDASAFRVRYKVMDATQWTVYGQTLCGTSGYVNGNFEVGETYIFQVQAIGNQYNSDSEWSDAQQIVGEGALPAAVPGAVATNGWSESQLVTINFVAPTFNTIQTSMVDTQIVKMSVVMTTMPSTTISGWVIFWGDNTSTQVTGKMSSVTLAHYYALDGDYDISVKINDVENIASNYTYYLGTHTRKTEQAASAALPVDDSTSVALAAVLPVAAPDAVLIDTENSLDVVIDTNPGYSSTTIASTTLFDSTARSSRFDHWNPSWFRKDNFLNQNSMKRRSVLCTDQLFEQNEEDIVDNDFGFESQIDPSQNLASVYDEVLNELL